MQVAVVIPIHKSTLTPYERISLAQCHKQLGKYPIIIIKPRSLVPDSEITGYNFSAIISFDDSFFDSVRSYNRLMMTASFYEAFSAYDHILIHQLDAFVFKDDLLQWCSQGFDYIGAPWIRIRDKMNPLHIFMSRLRHILYMRTDPKKIGVKDLDQLENQVGNGGLSLRRVDRFAQLCNELQGVICVYLEGDDYRFNEDVFWSIETNRGNKRLNIPGWRTALKFAFEIAPERARNLNNGNLPFGCHAWDRNIEFWRPIFAEYGWVIESRD